MLTRAEQVTKTEFVLFDKRTTVLQSAVSDLCTFAPLAFLVWISHGSRWWTFFAGCLALMWVLIRIVAIANGERRKVFKSTAELRAWADEQDRIAATGEKA